LLGAAGAAHADFKEDYSRGLAALKDGNYAEARAQLQKAMSAQPEAALRVRLYGQRWEPYLPQHYLGVAAFKMGDCAAALALWNSSENKQTISQLAELQGEQQRDIAECSKTALAKKDESATPKAAEAKPAVTAAAPPPASPKPAPAETVVQKPAPADATSTKPPAPDPGKPVAPPPEAQKIASAKPAAPPPAPAQDSSGAAPPDSLIAAFDKYLAGRYSEVAAIDPNGYRDARSRYHAYLLRAAARYTLSLVGGDQSLVDAAREDIKAARAANAKAAPDATMFSPRFRTFFSQSR
jgi:hypothetical protein